MLGTTDVEGISMLRPLANSFVLTSLLGIGVGILSAFPQPVFGDEVPTKNIPNEVTQSTDASIVAGLERAANGGDSKAMQRLADIYFFGKLAPSNGELAIKYYEMAANAGNKDVLVRLGEIYRDGKIVNTSLDKALDYFKRAANAGNSSAKMQLGRMYLAESGPNANPAAGIKLLEEAASTGDKGALQTLGDAYYKGLSVKVDGAKALQYYKAALDAGNRGVLLKLGEIYRDGIFVDANPALAFSYFQQAADADNIWAKVQVGRAYISGLGVEADHEKGIAIIEDVAKGGNGDALQLLGDFYQKGEIVSRDPKRARAEYEKSAAVGNPSAYVRLADLYRDGSDIPRSYEKSIEYYKKAIELGDTRAEVNLGENHAKRNFGKLSSPKIGIELLDHAVAAGDRRAVTVLANLYFSGTGVPRDIQHGLQLLAGAADNGSAPAASSLIALYRDGDLKQIDRNIEKAQSLLEKYKEIYLPGELIREQIALQAALAKTPTQLRDLAAALKSAPPSVQGETLQAIRKSNPNGFVLIGQIRMKEKGIYGGPLNGLLTSSTISAFRSLCNQIPTSGKCDRGPLHWSSAALISTLLN
jgi:TPR repeat protein